MREVKIAQNISELRKKKQITQDELARALNVSPQAISKWENATCQPDTLTIPRIADFFNVSIDYLFYGNVEIYDDIYENIKEKFYSFPLGSNESFEEFLNVFEAAHCGIAQKVAHGRDVGPGWQKNSHLSHNCGFSLLNGAGFGAVVTRNFISEINRETIDLARKIFEILSDEDTLLVTTAILSLFDITYAELREKTGLDDERLKKAISNLTEAELVLESKSRHQAIGTTYRIHGIYYNCIFLLLSTMHMQRVSLQGICCWICYGEFPISLDR
jgi:transcriptional regulator with XRE-family HTH domain